MPHDPNLNPSGRKDFPDCHTLTVAPALPHTYIIYTHDNKIKYYNLKSYTFLLLKQREVVKIKISSPPYGN